MNRVMGVRAHRANRLRTIALCRRVLVRLIKTEPTVLGLADGVTFKAGAQLSLLPFRTPQSLHQLF